MPTPPAAVPTAVAATDAAPVEQGEPFRLELPGHGAAPWLQAPLTDAECPDAEACAEPALWNDSLPEEDAVLAVGTRSAAIATLSGVFVHHLEHGILGPLALPEAADKLEPGRLGFGARDEIFFASASGRLYWAADARAGTRQLESRGSVPAARSWDFVPGLVVAATVEAIWVSTDSGKRFRETVPAKGATYASVLARPDGVVVAEAGDGEIYVSRNRGRTWRKSLLTGPSPSRYGSWISLCGATLSSDGNRWTGAEAPERDDPRVWTAPFALGDRPRGHIVSRPVTVSDPPPPAPPTPADDHRGTLGCSGPPGRGLGRSFRGLGDMGRSLTFEPYGFERMSKTPIGPAAQQTRTHYAFLADGLCAKEHRASDDESTCEDGAPLTRLPHIVAVDRVTSRMSMFPVPSGCAPERIADAAGAGLLFCRVSETELGVELLGRGGPAASETHLRLGARAPEQVAVFGDGSLLVFASPEGESAPLTVAVRAPSPLGTFGSWRTVRVPGAIAYRVGPGGAVVAVVPAGDGDASFRLMLNRRAGEESVEIARAQPVQGGLDEVWFTDDGRVALRRHSPDGEPSELVVSTTGGLIPAPKG